MAGFQSFNGKLFFFDGGGDVNTTAPYYYNDVWSSADGKNWTLETDSAAFPGRYWFGSTVFDNKIWLLGGYSYYNEVNELYRGNVNDVWYSNDGVHWKQFDEPAWPQRHAMLSWVKDDKLFVSGGYGVKLYMMFGDSRRHVSLKRI